MLPTNSYASVVSTRVIMTSHMDRGSFAHIRAGENQEDEALSGFSILHIIAEYTQLFPMSEDSFVTLQNFRCNSQGRLV